jgi:hypothetical protein
MSNKKKSPCTAATVAEARPINQFNYSYEQPFCKVNLADTTPDSIDAKFLTAISAMKRAHYNDGLNGMPYCNKITYEGYITAFGTSPCKGVDNRIMIWIYGLCDRLFRESWERGRTDSIAKKYVCMARQITTAAN